MTLKIGIVGATGNVGREMLSILSEKGFKSENIFPIAMGKIFSDLKPFSESIESISLPTFPVAPTIPIFKVIMILYYYKPQQSYHPFAE